MITDPCLQSTSAILVPLFTLLDISKLLSGAYSNANH
jgi:hypothetical protein